MLLTYKSQTILAEISSNGIYMYHSTVLSICFNPHNAIYPINMATSQISVPKFILTA